MRIVDSFCYFNEKELLELRINLMRDHVDQFLIFEGTRTFRGDPKPLTCVETLNELGLMAENIRVVTVEMPSKEEEPSDWVREHIQKDAISQYVTDDMVVICTDLDEMMDPRYVKYYVTSALRAPHNIIRIPMWWLVARGDLQLRSDDGVTPGVNMCAFVGLPQHLRRHKLSEIRMSYARNLKNLAFGDAFIIDNGINEIAGWHMTWMGGNSRILEKFYALTSHKGLLHTAPGKGDDEAVLQFMRTYNPSSGSLDPLGRRDHVLMPFDVSLLPKLVWQLPRVKKLLFPETT